MKSCFHPVALTLGILAASAIPAPARPQAQETPPHESTLERWREMRFGMFIHWGPVSLRGTEIGWSRQGPRRGRARPEDG